MTNLEKEMKERDELNDKEFMEVINEMLERIQDGENPQEILEESGFEIDYLFDLLNYM
jgi:flagellar motor component MotA